MPKSCINQRQDSVNQTPLTLINICQISLKLQTAPECFDACFPLIALLRITGYLP